MKQRRIDQEIAVLLLSLPHSPNKIWASRRPFFLGEIYSLLCNATFIDGIFPKSLFKEGERPRSNKTLEKSHRLYSFSCCSKKLAPHACQRIPFHSDLYVSARNDKLRAVEEKKAKRKLVFRSKETFHPTMRLYREQRR